ncbi:hypothetical protein B0H63DRAFT_528789 [Podospora didyma]|uniref:N-acetyltransferase domain-containing protein n=1 Tax=Podospora didyma TaxID=330526 RepID=A0AAE0K2V7_9PEZI|nr:hypothetical protein B0H63DRAFT_528789 [Podospora didyma]
MEGMASAFATTFRSERLIYSAIEETDEDKELLSRVLYDPVSQGLGDPTRFRPLSNMAGKKALDGMIKNALLAVMTCLPVDAAAADSTAAEQSEQSEQSEPLPALLPGTALKNAQASATPIGNIFLSRQPRPSTTRWRWTRISLQIAEPFQNKGYDGEAVNWALDWAFRFARMYRVELGTASSWGPRRVGDRVELGTASHNERTMRLYERLGFTMEGRRETIYSDRRW